MASKKKKKLLQQQKNITVPQQQPVREIKPPLNPVRFALVVTAGFFLVALIGLLNHEMWRDEHQAWLVARDANSLPQLLDNMNYEGNPALWHLFLFWITRFTHNPVYMQAFHLLLAVSAVYLFNRYAPLSNLHKLLFSFGYFTVYEYAVISRSYVLGILLVFAICALYKNRASYYILIGLLLALLANVTIYAVVIACGISGLLVLDYFLNQQKSNKILLQLTAGTILFILGLAFSLYQIWPEKDNSFPALYASGIFDFARWWQVSSKLFTTYFYIPQIDESFWNTSIFVNDPGLIVTDNFGEWLNNNPGYTMSWIVMPIITLAAGLLIFLRKPLILLLYSFTTFGLFSVYYYTALFHSRYCGYLLIALMICCWLGEYYPEKKYSGSLTGFFSRLGKKITKPFLTLLLAVNVAGAVVALSMDVQNKFTPSKDVADYIKKNKLDTLPIVAVTDFTTSPLATYLDTKLFYPQMNSTGSFIIWSNKRRDQLTYKDWENSLAAIINKGHPKILSVKDSAPQVSSDGKTSHDMEKAIVGGNLQVDLLAKFDNGTVKDEKYYIYLVQKVDPAKVDYSKYLRID